MSPVVAGLKPARPLRAGVSPSFMITTALAPALIAFWIFTTKSQVPRWTSAIAPAVKPAKSAASQPLVEPPGPPGLGTDEVDGDQRPRHVGVVGRREARRGLELEPGRVRRAADDAEDGRRARARVVVGEVVVVRPRSRRPRGARLT